jgi:hypothetical protein
MLQLQDGVYLLGNLILGLLLFLTHDLHADRGRTGRQPRASIFSEIFVEERL